jgi:hypothetical protein
MSITNPTDYEMRFVIPFLITKNIHSAEIHRHFAEVHEQGEYA